MPTSSTVLDAGSDWLLLGQRGELDVPTVALYRLVEGGALIEGARTMGPCRRAQPDRDPGGPSAVRSGD